MGTERTGGRVIAGRYRLETVLGRGGMGVVWRATDELLGRVVAVKELTLDDTLTSEESRRRRDRTLREARAVAQLRHPQVIVVHDVVAHDERPYLVMEFVDGGSLADRIAAQGPVDAREAARIGVALLGALRSAHAAGVLHRDLKPANVLVENHTGRVVLTDFGVAHVDGTTTLTESGSFVGSPEYTAPERMSGAGTGAAADLWSLGALLCAAVSGESPFRRDSLGAVVHAVLTDDIRLPAQAAPLLPVVRGLLERDPERRLDAAEAEWMLRGFLDTGRTPEPEQRMPRPRLLVAALVAATAVVGLSAAALLVNRDGDTGGSPTTPAPTNSVSSPRTTTSGTPAGTGSGTPSGDPGGFPAGTAPGEPGGGLTVSPTGSATGSPEEGTTGSPP